jgi:hypothetical protein
MKASICFGLLAAVLAVGCTSTKFEGRQVLPDSLADGQTTREDVLLTLGQPSARFESDRILTYRLVYNPNSKGFSIVQRDPAIQMGWSTWSTADHSLVLVFDGEGVLRRHSFVKVK